MGSACAGGESTAHLVEVVTVILERTRHLRDIVLDLKSIMNSDGNIVAATKVLDELLAVSPVVASPVVVTAGTAEEDAAMQRSMGLRRVYSSVVSAAAHAYVSARESACGIWDPDIVVLVARRLWPRSDARGLPTSTALL